MPPRGSDPAAGGPTDSGDAASAAEVVAIETERRRTWTRLLDRIDAFLAKVGPRRLALGAGTAALAARWLWLLVRSTPLDGDERGYLRLAENLAHHGRFALTPAGPLEAHFGPAYTALQAALVGAGLGSVSAGWAVSVVAGSLTVAAVALLGSRLWGRPAAGALAAALAVADPAMVSASTHLYPGALSSLFLVLAVASLAGTRRPGLLCGVFLGLAALTRREMILLIPLAAALVLAGGAGDPPPEPGRRRVREAALLLAAFAVLFGPYLVYLRAATGQWTLSAKTDYSWIVGRLMEERPGEGISFEEIHRLEARYPSPVDYLRAKPWETVSGLGGSAWEHLRWTFAGGLAWPMGVLGLAGLAFALARRRLRLWPPSPLLLPFVLVLAWSFAGPIQRYSKILGPFVCLLAGGILAARPAAASGGEGDDRAFAHSRMPGTGSSRGG